MLKRVRAIVAIAVSAVLATSLFGCSSSEEYAPELSSPTVSTPTIGEDGVLRVGVNSDRSPLAGMGSERIIGIDVDIAAAMADELGLKLEVTDVGTDAEKALADGEVDLVLDIDSSETHSGFWTSSDYIPTGVALFAMDSGSSTVPETASDKSIAAQVSSKSAWAVTNAFGTDALSSTTDLATAFTDLSSGSIDFVAADVIIGMYAANRQGIDVKVVALLGSPTGYCAGVAQENTELQTIVKDTLARLRSNGTIDVIEKKWLGSSIDLDGIQVIENKAQTTDDALDDNEEGADDDSASSSSSSAATAA